MQYSVVEGTDGATMHREVLYYCCCAVPLYMACLQYVCQLLRFLFPKREAAFVIQHYPVLVCTCTVLCMLINLGSSSISQSETEESFRGFRLFCLDLLLDLIVLAIDADLLALGSMTEEVPESVREEGVVPAKHIKNGSTKNRTT